MPVSKLKARLLKQFGAEARTEEIDGVLVVHLDLPDAKESARRRAEVRRGGPREKDCDLCKATAKNPPSVVVYDQDAVLCFGEDSRGTFATGFPRRAGQPA